MRFKGVGRGKILEEKYLAVSWREAIAAWWADRPRKTWIVAPYEGLYAVFFDLDDAQAERRHQNDVLGPGNEWRFSTVRPGAWMRPSQMEALEPFHDPGIDRKV
jgi:hypothetical protein